MLIDRSRAALLEGSAAREAVKAALEALRSTQLEEEKELRDLARQRLRSSLKEAEALALQHFEEKLLEDCNMRWFKDVQGMSKRRPA